MLIVFKIVDPLCMLFLLEFLWHFILTKEKHFSFEISDYILWMFLCCSLWHWQWITVCRRTTQRERLRTGLLVKQMGWRAERTSSSMWTLPSRWVAGMPPPATPQESAARNSRAASAIWDITERWESRLGDHMSHLLVEALENKNLMEKLVLYQA